MYILQCLDISRYLPPFLLHKLQYPLFSGRGPFSENLSKFGYNIMACLLCPKFATFCNATQGNIEQNTSVEFFVENRHIWQMSFWAVHKRRHQFLTLRPPPLPSPSLLLNKLNYLASPLTPIDDIFYEWLLLHIHMLRVGKTYVHALYIRQFIKIIQQIGFCIIIQSCKRPKRNFTETEIWHSYRTENQCQSYTVIKVNKSLQCRVWKSNHQ